MDVGENRVTGEPNLDPILNSDAQVLGGTISIGGSMEYAPTPVRVNLCAADTDSVG